MARRISITIPDDIERTVLALMESQGDPHREGAFSAALIGHIRALTLRATLQEQTIAALGRTPAPAPAPVATDSKTVPAAPSNDWGKEEW